MIDKDFYGPFLKVERAEHHINKLEAILRHYVTDNMKRLRPNYQQRALKQGRKITTATFPKHTPTVLGDAIHNLRASLDHAYCVLVEANGNVIGEYTRFPFGGDWQSIKGPIDGHKKTGKAPSETVIDYIGNEIQPYPGGKLRLFDLHRLDIADKHEALLPTVANFHIERLDMTDSAGNPTGGGIRNLTLAIPQGNYASATNFIDPGAGGAILHGKPEDAFQITFGEGKPLAGEKILETMRTLHEATKVALTGLQSFV